MNTNEKTSWLFKAMMFIFMSITRLLIPFTQVFVRGFTFFSIIIFVLTFSSVAMLPTLCVFLELSFLITQDHSS